VRVLLSSALMIALVLAQSAAAQPPFPEVESRAAALAALDSADASRRLAGVVYLGRNGLATDGKSFIKSKRIAPLKSR